MAIRLTIDFSTSTTKARGWWNSVFKVLKQKTANNILSSVKICEEWGQNKALCRQDKIRFLPVRVPQKQLLREIVQPKRKVQGNDEQRKL